MKKIALIGVMAALLLAACGAAAAGLPADGAHIPWSQAVDLIYAGKVDAVVQAHSLEVSLTLSNGARVSTTEPGIDMIFDVIDLCGAPCEGMAVATE